MPLQDVSNDPSMVDWLHRSGHGHLLDEQRQFSNIPSSISPSMMPVADSRVNNPNPDSYSHSVAYPQTDHNNSQSYDSRFRPIDYVSSPTQFLAPFSNQQQADMDIENMRRDPNTHIVQRPALDDVVYKQRVYMRYLQPPTPPPSGAIIIREKQPPPPPPDPPIVIRRAPPPPPTPPPVVIRERPPAMPPPEPTTIINKFVPAPGKPPRQVIVEQYPSLPPKPQDVIIERWLPIPPRQRRIFYERLPAPVVPQPKPIIVQYGQPQVQVHRQIITEPVPQCSPQQVLPHTDINQVLSQVHSTASPSSLISYNPYSTIQQSYGSISQPQSNLIITQNTQPSTISSSSYAMPLSCVCSPNSTVGLGGYGSGITTIPTVGYSSGQSLVYTVPENVPIDNVLRQFGVDPHTMQRSTDPNSAVSHAWNAAVHSVDQNQINSPSVVPTWNPIENYLQSRSAGPTQSLSNPIPNQNLSTGSNVLSRLFGGG